MPPAPVSVASTWDARPLAVCGVSGSRDRVEFSLRIRRPFLNEFAGGPKDEIINVHAYEEVLR